MSAKGTIPWNRGICKPEHLPVLDPTVRDIAWAAGVYEGEGYCFGRVSSHRGLKRKPSPYQIFGVRVAQKDIWLCERLRALFGGKVRTYKAKANSIKHPNLIREYNCWDILGSRALGFIQTIYTFLSPRRKAQVRVVLDMARRVSI